jgi:hypothetical protein
MPNSWETMVNVRGRPRPEEGCTGDTPIRDNIL